MVMRWSAVVLLPHSKKFLGSNLTTAAWSLHGEVGFAPISSHSPDTDADQVNRLSKLPRGVNLSVFRRCVRPVRDGYRIQDVPRLLPVSAGTGSGFSVIRIR